MSRKVFISVLGTGFYNECAYRMGDGRTSAPTRFVQQAMLDLLGAREWSEDDHVFIMTTAKAKAQNWSKSIEKRRPRVGEPEVIYRGLETLLNEMELKARVETIDIPDGKDENEMWHIFDLLFDCLEEGDELYFDLTHSYRYLPMLLLVFGNYAKFLKGVEVRSITYGNFEARNEKDVAPIVDLMPLTALQDWTFGIADYLRNGNIVRLSELAAESLRPLLRHAYSNEGSDMMRLSTTRLRNIVGQLETVVQERQTCRGLNVIESKAVSSFLENMKHVEEATTLLPALSHLLEKIVDSMGVFDCHPNVRNAFAAAEWCYQNQQYQAAITFLEEGVISLLCQRNGLDMMAEEERDIVNMAANIALREIPEEEWRVADKKKSVLRELLLDELLQNRDFLNVYGSVCQIRNDYNHCGMRSRVAPLSPARMIQNIGNAINRIMGHLFGPR